MTQIFRDTDWGRNMAIYPLTSVMNQIPNSDVTNNETVRTESRVSWTFVQESGAGKTKAARSLKALPKSSRSRGV